MSHQYDKDIERLKARVELVLSSFEGAPDVDEDYVEIARAEFKTGFAFLDLSVKDA